MKYYSSNLFLFLALIIFSPGLSFPQPLVTIEEIQYQHPDSLLLYGDKPSPYNDQTVTLRGVVMVSPLVNAQTDRRPIMWVGARWATYLNDPDGIIYPNYDGLMILQDDTTDPNQGTFFNQIDTAQVVEVTATISEYITTTEGFLQLTPVTPVTIISQLPKRPDPIELSISDFMSVGSLNPLAEKYEGQYVIIRNVVTSNRDTTWGIFRINDGLGNYMVMSDRSGYFTKRAHRLNGLTSYEPPEDGTTLSYIRGMINTRTDAYYIEPMYPGDIKEIQTSSLTVNVADGWNMVSVPGLHPVNQNVNTWWTFRDPGANVFKYAGGYQSVTSVIPGQGYWMKHLGGWIYIIPGIQIVPHTPLAGASGWNLIGGYEISATAANVTTNPPGLQSGPIYKYSGGYQVATTLDPGYGYWIKLSAAGQIIIPETFAKGEEPVEMYPENWGKIILTDATGINYTLYVINGEVNLDQYELPPAPPAGMFDIRFSSGRIAEDINSSIKTIDMSGVTYPLTVRVEGMDMRLMDETGKTVNVNLKSGEDVVIRDATIQKLKVSSEPIPTVYALEQNYPNPFNPSTKIKFSVAKEVQVNLNVFNILGEKVKELKNEMMKPGYYEVEFNAADLASGIYFYWIQAGDFVETKKMVLLK